MTTLEDRIERYLADELSEQDRLTFDRLIENDPLARRRLESVIKLNTIVHSAACEIDHAPLSPQLALDVDQLTSAHCDDPSAAGVLRRSFADVLTCYVSAMAKSLSPAMMIAACCVAMVGVIIGIRSTIFAHDTDLVVMGLPISELADTLASGSSDKGIQFTASYRNSDGNVCRSFIVVEDANVQGLVCSTGPSWSLVALTERQSGAYAPAGETSDLIEGYVSQMEPLTAEQESRFLASR
ncbi:MAG: hypothetical protein AAF668_01290 [Pseudomonadota bacterium]